MSSVQADKQFTRRLAWAEILAALVIFQFYIWVILPLAGDRFWAWMLLVGLATSGGYLFLVSPRIWQFIGAHKLIANHSIGGSRLLADLPFYAVATVLAGLFIFLLSLLTNPNWNGVDTSTLATGALRYLSLAAIQVGFYYVFIYPRLKVAISSDSASDWRPVILMAAIFSLCHVPNVALMLGGSVIALAWTWVYQRRPNQLLLCSSHMVLGTLLVVVAKVPTRVGHAYFEQDFWPFRLALAIAWNDVSTIWFIY